MPQFPFLTILISGGHTLLILATSLTNFRILATTVDESIGRVFDKVSRMLCLKWTDLGPGAALEQFCAEDNEEGIEGSEPPLMPQSMPSQLAFSYAGLHSAVERYIFNRGGVQNLDTQSRRALGRAFQAAAVAQLEEKLALGLKWCEHKGIKVEHVVVSGGVASNKFLRDR
jgi:N6-L-threonylcarbamoyladenine synthase